MGALSVDRGIRTNSHATPAPAIAKAAAKPADPLAGIGAVIAVAANGIIHAEGDAATQCYRVLSGVVRVSKLTADGRRQIVRFLLPGDMLGLEARSVHTLGAEAIGPTVLVRYARRQVEALADRDLRVAAWLRSQISGALITTEDHMVMLGQSSARERVAHFLVALASRAHAADADDVDDLPGAVDLAMSRYDIADHLGLTVETVSRTLTMLKREGTISIVGTHHIEFTDPEQLLADAAEPRGHA